MRRGDGEWFTATERWRTVTFVRFGRLVNVTLRYYSIRLLAEKTTLFCSLNYLTQYYILHTFLPSRLRGIPEDLRQRLRRILQLLFLSLADVRVIKIVIIRPDESQICAAIWVWRGSVM